LPRQDHVWITTENLFRFHNNKFDEMPCKLDSTEDARSFRTKPNTAFIRRDKLRILSVGRRRLLQRYWYKVLVLHIVKYHLIVIKKGGTGACGPQKPPGAQSNSGCQLIAIKWYLTVPLYLAKNGFETQKVKNWYRQPRCLPHTPISSLYKIYMWGGVSTPWGQSMRIIFGFTDTYSQSANCVNCDDTNQWKFNCI